MSLPKLIAIYFPQFHPVKENDEWWGEGFTDWKLVQESKALFSGHNQPRIPLNEKYYNPCDKDTLKEQALLAKKYAIDGFMFYHYWFDGKLLLDKPLETFLSNPEIDISFCLSWANESWTRSWIGKPEIILQKQSHKNDKEIWKAHFHYLLPFFKDPRAIRIDDKPVFLIYQPTLIIDSTEMVEFWQSLAKENGLNGIYFIASKNHEFQNDDFLKSYDGIMKFQPREAYSSPSFSGQNVLAKLNFLRRLPEPVKLILTKLLQRFSKYQIFDSKKIWEIILNNAYSDKVGNHKLDIYESGFFEWDNTPRYKDKAKIFSGLSLQNKKENLKKLMEMARESDSPFVFFNAWNEWSESAYLEPDTNNEYQHLEIIKEVIQEL